MTDYSDYPNDGSIPDVLGWVDDEPDRARHAEAVEISSANPRTTLLAQLAKIEDDGPDDDGDVAPGDGDVPEVEGASTNRGPGVGTFVGLGVEHASFGDAGEFAVEPTTGMITGPA